MRLTKGQIRIRNENPADRLKSRISQLAEKIKTKKGNFGELMTRMERLGDLSKHSGYTYEALDAFLSCLGHNEKDVRLKAKLALISAISDPKSKDAVFTLLNDALLDNEPKQTKMFILSVLDDAASENYDISPSFATIGALMRDEDEEIRVSAINAMVAYYEGMTVRDASALVGHLTILMDSDNEKIRWSAIVCLDRLNDAGVSIHSARPELMRAVSDPSDLVKGVATQTVWKSLGI